ncbi:MAG TPA: hypothetical protein VD908_16070 [Cytophagales bacterium]|nr:hypothetical protein [Cytophagales bacterium]
MEKFGVVIFFFVIMAFTSFSQEIPGFVFSEVIVVDSLDSGNLLKTGKEWVVENGFTSIDTSGLNEVKAENSFFVYQKGLISKQVHGKISYTFLLEVKNNKYKYTFSEFTFHYYKQNRNYEMKPTGKEKSLNDPTAKGWQKTWVQHKYSTKKDILLFIQSLKESLIPVIQPQVVKQSTPSDF